MPLPLGALPPASIYAGDSLLWRHVARDVSPAEATLVVRVYSASYSVEVLGVADGDGWLISVAPSETKRMGSGLLKWVARATLTNGNVHTVGDGAVQSQASPALGGGGDTLSHAGRLVKSLEAQLEKLAASAVTEYGVGERNAKYRDMDKVQAALNAARARLAAERNGGRSVMRSHSVRF